MRDVVGGASSSSFGIRRVVWPRRGDLDAPPFLGGADDGGVHEFEHRTFAEGVGTFGAAALVAEKAFEQIGRPDDSAVSRGESQVGDASMEVFLEAGDRRGELTSVASDDTLALGRRPAVKGPDSRPGLATETPATRSRVLCSGDSSFDEPDIAGEASAEKHSTTARINPGP